MVILVQLWIQLARAKQERASKSDKQTNPICLFSFSSIYPFLLAIGWLAGSREQLSLAGQFLHSRACLPALIM